LEKKAKIHRQGGIAYRMFKSYIRFFHDRIYYRRTYSLNTENMPPAGAPLMIVSNHQNCLNDPLGILMSIRDRKPYFIMRADVFAYHPLLNKFFRSIGLLPAFRIDYEGEDALQKNKDTFLISEYELVNGSSLMMFPEAGHQNKRWLGDFSYGYTKMVFEAAALDHFQTEIFILPSCNHYSDYFQIQEQMLIKYGVPISVKPFYKLYQTKPRTAQRQVSALVRKQIEDLMLDIRDWIITKRLILSGTHRMAKILQRFTAMMKKNCRIVCYQTVCWLLHWKRPKQMAMKIYFQRFMRIR